MTIREASASDHDAVWDIFREVVAAGDTYVFDPDTPRDRAIAYWFQDGVRSYVAEGDGRVVGTYILKPNQPGLGSHVANAAFMVSPAARGRGVGRAMGAHCLREARRLGYRAMQFNFVVSTNRAAVRLWEQLGFRVVGTLPGAFRHRTLGFVDALVMFRSLEGLDLPAEPNDVRIEPSTPDDIDAIFRLYAAATRLQRDKGMVAWPAFDRGVVADEVAAGRQWKVVADGEPRCVWAVADNDPHIWGDRDADPAVYLHRIAADPAYRGRGFVRLVVDWAKAYAAANGRRFVRMDTVGHNPGLIRHYTACGFAFLGLSEPADTSGLPAHYHHATVCLFEIDLG